VKIKKGLTLFELIIAIIIISICALSLAVMYQEAMRGNSTIKPMTIATALAEEKAEQVLGLGYSGVSNSGPTYFPSPFDEYSFQVIVHYVQASNLDTSVDPTQTSYKNVEIKVMQNDIGTISIKSLLTDFSG
jgi:prepilin-type N-terminal cleavage/methylation domain-containing protein